MRVLIISNGELGDANHVKSMIPSWDFVICADGGTKYAERMGIVPNVIVGDLDSLSPSVMEGYREQGVHVKQYSKDKDWTDTQIAVDLAVEMGAREVIMLGSLGTRWDHSYANLMLLYRMAKRNVAGLILDTHNQILVTDKTLNISGRKGDILSLLPLGEDVHIHSTKGLKYPLKDDVLQLDFPLGISNVFIESEAVIEIKSGWLIVIKARD